jgi:hypothetical protein
LSSGGTYSGVTLIRGWAVARSGILKVEASIDDVLYSDIPIKAPRADVANAYPTFPGNAESGFAMTFPWFVLPPGKHKLTINAIETTGASTEVSAVFNVVRFENPLMLEPGAVNLDQASFKRNGNSAFTIQRLMADGKPYEVRLSWQPSTQGFTITEITPMFEPEGRKP